MRRTDYFFGASLAAIVFTLSHQVVHALQGIQQGRFEPIALLPWGILHVLAGAVVFAFWIWTIRCWIKRDNRAGYLLLLIFMTIIGAYIYYFRVVRPAQSSGTK
ncbi:MAG: hypothetical protein IPP83_02400 [Flavobacteriales bacterium]|nr:hypothetical protein [Flavobacteriales bacterium]